MRPFFAYTNLLVKNFCCLPKVSFGVTRGVQAWPILCLAVLLKGISPRKNIGFNGIGTGK